MSIITLILGLAIGFIAGRGLWRGTLARLGAWATAAAKSWRSRLHRSVKWRSAKTKRT